MVVSDRQNPGASPGCPEWADDGCRNRDSSDERRGEGVPHSLCRETDQRGSTGAQIWHVFFCLGDWIPTTNTQ